MTSTTQKLDPCHLDRIYLVKRRDKSVSLCVCNALFDTANKPMGGGTLKSRPFGN
jgi:hypothetical protein